jgi:hypothetical protein
MPEQESVVDDAENSVKSTTVNMPKRCAYCGLTHRDYDAECDAYYAANNKTNTLLVVAYLLGAAKYASDIVELYPSVNISMSIGEDGVTVSTVVVMRHRQTMNSKSLCKWDALSSSKVNPLVQAIDRMVRVLNDHQ